MISFVPSQTQKKVTLPEMPTTLKNLAQNDGVNTRFWTWLAGGPAMDSQILNIFGAHPADSTRWTSYVLVDQRAQVRARGHLDSDTSLNQVLRSMASLINTIPGAPTR
jgi:hypothetical protein